MKTEFYALLAVIAFGSMCFSYGHSMQTDIEPAVVAKPVVVTRTVYEQRSQNECLASALNLSQLGMPQSRSKKHIPLPIQLAQR